jgi:excisionase family DNA binding protein
VREYVAWLLFTEATMATAQQDPLLDPEASGIYLGRTDPQAGVRFMYRLVAERKIAYVKSGALLRFRQSALDAYLAERTVEPASATPTLLSDADREAVRKSRRAPRRQPRRYRKAA